MPMQVKTWLYIKLIQTKIWKITILKPTKSFAKKHLIIMLSFSYYNMSGNSFSMVLTENN